MKKRLISRTDTAALFHRESASYETKMLRSLPLRRKGRCRLNHPPQAQKSKGGLFLFYGDSLNNVSS